MERPIFQGIWREDPRARAAYAEGAGIYRIIPEAVAVPSTTKGLVDLVRWAAANQAPLIPRGAGSGMPGGNVGAGVIVDLTALDGTPIHIDPVAMIATTGSGVSLGALAEAAGRHGLRMPVDPSSARWATAGGAVGTNAAGPRTVKYGPVRRWVEGLTIVTADPEIIRLERGVKAPDSALVRRVHVALNDTLRLARWRVASTFPKVRKNTAGYGLDSWLESGDLLDLIVGSEGTLGIVTEVRWRLEPTPRHRLGLRAALRDVRRLSNCVPALLELAPSRVEFLDGTFLKFAAEQIRALPRGERLIDAGAVLMVEFEGSELVPLAHDLERAVGILRPESLEVAVGQDAKELDTLWEIRHAASPRLASLGPIRRSLQVIEDGAVPITRLGDYLAAVQAIATQRSIPVVMFGHAGDGNVHANLLPDVTEAGFQEVLQATFEDVARLVIALGGSPSGEHGDGRLRSGLIERVYGFEVAQVFRQIKRAFDPQGIMNPGVKIDLGPAGLPIRSLKVGPGAVGLPDDIAAGLRRIEQQAGYATSRLALADEF